MIVLYENENWSTIGFLSYPEKGVISSGKCICLLHGKGGSNLGLNHSFIKLENKAIEAGFIVFRFDLPGEGESIIYNKDLNKPEAINGLLGFLKANYKLQNISLIGHCSGGLVSLYLKFKYPSLFNKLVLWDLSDCFLEMENGRGVSYSIKYLLHRYIHKLFRRETWYKFVTLKIQWRIIVISFMKSVTSYILRLIPFSENDFIITPMNEDHTNCECLVIHSSKINNYKKIITLTNNLCVKANLKASNMILHEQRFSVNWQVSSIQESIKFLH